MAGESNIPRKRTCEGLWSQVEALRKITGVLLTLVRGYTGASKQADYTQTALADVINARMANAASQPKLSDFENMKVIPQDAVLREYLICYGFDPANKDGGRALFELLRFFRDHAANLEKLAGEEPTTP